MRKIAVSLTKGGVGKTTSVVNLAAGLGLAGYKVLLVDTDTQNQVARSLGCQPEHGLAELALGEISAEQAVVPLRPNLWILGGGRSLIGLKMLISKKEFGGEQTLSEILAPFEGQYDFVLLDTSPGWDPLTINALFYVQEVLAPVSLEIMTLQSLVEFTRSLAAIQKYHPALALKYVLPTFLDRRVRKSDEILQQLQAHYPGKTCDPIRYSVRLSEAPGYGQSIFEYAPNSPGARDYQKLLERIVENDRT